MVKVLIIDDDDKLRTLVRDALIDEGYHVDEASGGWAGLKCCEIMMPDIVITDILMAEGEGIETILELSRRAPLLPIIAMSGKIDYLRNAQNLGASRVLAKPFRMPQLLQIVDDLIALEFT